MFPKFFEYFKTNRQKAPSDDDAAVLKNTGYCPICAEETVFVAKESWLRDHYLCLRCSSIPRERALMRVLEQFYPDWSARVIHESSPGQRGATVRLLNECPSYFQSYFFADVKPGDKKGELLCEDLENLSFQDESIDIHVSQDVLEHIFRPEKAFKEIARTLKPGGAHIFTVPIVNKFKPTACRASQDSRGNITYVEKAIYHGNPIDSSGSLVTFDWGYDIVELIWKATALPTFIIQIDDLHNGIRAEYIDVFVTRKPDTP